MKPFFVYMLECSDRSFYVGHTDDLETRIAQHESGAFGRHTAALRPVKLVWSQEFVERDEAFWMERKLKGWSRAKKRALIEGDWSSIRALAASRGGADTRRCRNAPGDRSCFDRLSTSGQEVPARPTGEPQPPARPEPVEGRGGVEGNRSCFDKLSTSGHELPARSSGSQTPARPTGGPPPPARPEPVEGREEAGSDRSCFDRLSTSGEERPSLMEPTPARPDPSTSSGEGRASIGPR